MKFDNLLSHILETITTDFATSYHEGPIDASPPEVGKYGNIVPAMKDFMAEGDARNVYGFDFKKKPSKKPQKKKPQKKSPKKKK